MKNFVKILIISFGIFGFLDAKSFDEYKNYENTKDRAILIESYLNSHKRQIQNFTKKYNIESNTNINREINNIDLLIKSLELIQQKNIDSNKEVELINKIVSEIKKINDRLKILLQEKKEVSSLNLEKTIQEYWHLWIKLSVEINKITKNFEYIEQKEVYTLSRNESNIKKSVSRLKELSYLLKMFWKLNFSNENELKISFKKTIIEIREEMKIIKQNI